MDDNSFNLLNSRYVDLVSNMEQFQENILNFNIDKESNYYNEKLSNTINDIGIETINLVRDLVINVKKINNLYNEYNHIVKQKKDDELNKLFMTWCYYEFYNNNNNEYCYDINNASYDTNDNSNEINHSSNGIDDID